MHNYLEQVKTKEILSLTKEIETLKKDNYTMAKQIHKDNKLLPVMHLAIIELIKEYGETNEIKEIQAQLDTLIKERYNINKNTTKNNVSCNLPSIDALFKYFQYKSEQESINFEFKTEEKVLKNMNISITDLNIILCELCENALIAVKNQTKKNILLNINSNDSTLTILVFDSGPPFSKEVLKNIGRKKITTHAETGGSGIGLVTIFDILKKYKGTFQIQNCHSTSQYTKCIIITV